MFQECSRNVPGSMTMLDWNAFASTRVRRHASSGRNGMQTLQRRPWRPLPSRSSDRPSRGLPAALGEELVEALGWFGLLPLIDGFQVNQMNFM